MPTINPSSCSDAAASSHEDDQTEAFRVNFDRIAPGCAQEISGEHAGYHLNRYFMVFQGLNAINRLLLANDVAKDCAEPTLNGNVVGGLMSAAIALSDMAIDDIERLADWADKRALEVRHD